MTEDAQPMTRKQKIDAVKKVQFQLENGQLKHPLVRACGLTELELRVLTNELLVEVFDDADTDDYRDKYRIASILPAGFAILSQAAVDAPEPIQVMLVTPPKSCGRSIFEWMASNIPALIIGSVLAVLGGIFVAWFVWIHHWN
jgi:hypothetical protein